MKGFVYGIYFLAICAVVNGYAYMARQPRLLFLFIPLYLFINLFAGVFLSKAKALRLRVCYHGAGLLLLFELSTLIAFFYHIALAFSLLPKDPKAFLWSALVCIGLEAILFWNGILCVYLTSVQLGIKQRVIGAVCGMIPIANLIALNSIIKTALKEVRFEGEKERINEQRRELQTCKTKYPILMVHGVFFRDSKYFNYWGRIPKELERNGARICYGNHQSAASVAKSAEELTIRIKALVEELHCEKVNIIAHSKGGLDCRYAMAKLGAAPFVASLTTVNTPHRGCLFADYLLEKLPVSLKEKVAASYNAALRKFGDYDPDFLAAVEDLTAVSCIRREAEMPLPQGVFCQSVGSILPRAQGGKFPLNFSYHLVRYFDGPNDGLVSEGSFEWGEKWILLSPPKKRGISHGDMIDLNRENIEGFDVREFYVGLVSDLKRRGL